MANNFCEQCGAPLVTGSRFCESCGHPVQEKLIEQSNTPEPVKKQGKQLIFIISAIVMVGVVAIICLVLLVTNITIPGNIFNKELPEEQYTGFERQDAPAMDYIVTDSNVNKPNNQQPVEITPLPTTEPIKQVTNDRSTFYCISDDGPTTMTITANTASDLQDLSLRWRLNTKNEGKTTEWEGVYMEKIAVGQFTYTFNADVWKGTNNFYYPPMLGESWFEYQVFLPDGSYQTEIFKDLTFFPCAQ